MLSTVACAAPAFLSGVNVEQDSERAGARRHLLTKRFPADPKVALHALASSYTVMARNAIFVLLVGGINSDLPGPILAQVRTGLSEAT